METPLRVWHGYECRIACYTLSRLKGMETQTKKDPAKRRWGEPCYTLSRLKGIETLSCGPRSSSSASCYTLSRLKGIETQLRCGFASTPQQ